MISPRELLRFRYFAGMPQSILDGIASVSSLRKFTTGDRLFEEGADAHHLMIVKDGRVDITYRLGDGREVAADSAVAGDVVGWSAMLDPYKMTGSGVAVKDGELIAIDAAPLRRMCENDSILGYQLMTEIARALRERLTGMHVQLAASQ